MRRKYCLLLFLIIPFCLWAEDTPTGSEGVTNKETLFVNTGSMQIMSNGKMYVKTGMKMLGSDVKVNHDGAISLEGSFLHDGAGTVFTMEESTPDGYNYSYKRTSSVGTLRFVENNDKGRLIDKVGETSYDRSTSYIAFPNLEIATTDTIFIPAYMGIDANSIKRKNSDAANKGHVLLESDPIGDNIYTTSLRINNSNTNNGAIVTDGSIVIEQYVAPFRLSNTTNNNNYIYPFATPFNGMYAGYYSGNWVRTPDIDEDWHTRYILANKPDPNKPGYIDTDQYVKGFSDPLETTRPYLLVLRPASLNLEDTNMIVGVTEKEETEERYIFDGLPFTSADYEEGDHSDYLQNLRLHTGSLFNHAAPVSKGSSTNWIIGNSYTSSIDASALLDRMINSGISFNTDIYVYHAGATGYKKYVFDGNSTTPKLPNIPAMGVFMIRVAGNNASDLNFELLHDMQVHSGSNYSKTPPALSPASKESRDEFTLRITPENNPFIYDETYIRFANDGYLVTKLLNTTNEYFQIYTKNGTSNMQNNVVPMDTNSVRLCVTPPTNGINCTLSVTDPDAVDTESLILHDELLNQYIDLREEKSYTFLSQSGDITERFMLYFTNPTYIEDIQQTPISVYYTSSQLYIKGLTEYDMRASYCLYNTQGQCIYRGYISSYPEQVTNISLNTGVYILQVVGNRQITTKIIVGKNTEQ
ncbi:T9SS type A sorting domain-containing protein [Bacteroidales bacterium OttesenSCG-928-M11]|nr:T9SS type A sorting domain-containing protein [Bacteroidales bacterium OttesenSCG-928-M11]